MAHPNYPPTYQPYTYPPPPLSPGTQPYYPTAQQQHYYSSTSSSYASAANYPHANHDPSAAAYPPQPPACPPPTYYPPGPIPVPPMISPIPVVGPQYCVPGPVDLMIVRKLMTLTDDFTVMDVNKNVLFKEEGKLLTLHDRRVLLDPAGSPILTLRQKILTAHNRWEAFRGDSSEPRDLIFSAKTSSVIQLKTKLNVYLAHRTSEDVCDFKVKGSWTNGSCVVYVGDSTTVAAQMKKKNDAQSFFLGKDTFMVTVSPNIDFAFVVALILILDTIKSPADVSMKIVKTAVTGNISG